MLLNFNITEKNEKILAQNSANVKLSSTQARKQHRNKGGKDNKRIKRTQEKAWKRREETLGTGEEREEREREKAAGGQEKV